MSLQNYLLYVGACFVLVIVPGPDMIYMLSRCIAQGKKAGLMAAIGFNLGGYFHMTMAILGLSAILATSAFAFMLIKWAGAVYLVYLGITAICSKTGPIALNASGLTSRSARTILWQAFLSDVLNPKVALFFLTLLPQFVAVNSPHPNLQILLLGVTVCVIALPVNILLVYFSARVTRSLRENNTIATWLQKAMGAIFVALGLKLAAEKI
jgi:threonine/homoserine/homoserine lactone efflux protein